MSRSEWTERIVTVRHVARPSGRNADNPPNLADFRTFVSLCEGLPDDTHVHVDKGSITEGGRHDMTFSVRLVQRTEDEATP